MGIIPKDILRELAKNSSEGMILTDISDTVLFINHSAQQLLNIKEENIEKLTSIFGSTSNILSEQCFINYANKKLLLRPLRMTGLSAEYKIFYIEEIINEEQNNEELEFLRNIIDHIDEGIIATNKDGKIVVYNNQLAEFEGLIKNKTEGKNLTDIYDVTPETSEHMQVLKTAKPIKDLNRKYFTKSGKFMHLIASTYPLTKNNKTVGAFSISRNVSKIRELFSNTMELQNKFQPAGRISNNGTRYTFEDIIGKSPAIRTLIKEAKKAALTQSPVLICGETGTGKELFVQSIHNWSMQKENPFIGVNCAAIPESLLESLLFGTVKGAFTGAENSKGLFEQAENGTLFLDEINSLPINLQPKLLRAIQEKTIRRIGGSKEIPINCRIISSSNEDLLTMINNDNFRKDFYYRIAVIVLTVPPLRERDEDIKFLANYFIQKYARIYGHKPLNLSNELIKFLLEYNWPGNVREIEHVFESSIAMLEDADELTINHLPLYLKSKLVNTNVDFYNSGIKTKQLNKILKEVEKKVIEDALRDNNGNITQAGKSIGICRQNMQYRMNKLGIRNID